MPFDQSPITSVSPPEYDGPELYLSWSATSPAGSIFQVYIGGRLSWYGASTRCRVPAPPTAESPTRVDIGVVPASQATSDFSASLPSAPGRRITLEWEGGSFLGASFWGFHVYGATAPGGPVDYSSPIATIPGYQGGAAIDGFGLAGFGDGGFGMAPSSYSWTSGALASGSWEFAVAACDEAGNDGPPQAWTGTISAPPMPPAAFPGSAARLQYSLAGFGRTAFGSGGFGFPGVTLQWNTSPG